jgi:hypothetical protein
VHFSILAACGEDPAYVMAQLGHTDPKFTLRVSLPAELYAVDGGDPLAHEGFICSRSP